jgi:hypothetical protein
LNIWGRLMRQIPVMTTAKTCVATALGVRPE